MICIHRSPNPTPGQDQLYLHDFRTRRQFLDALQLRRRRARLDRVEAPGPRRNRSARFSYARTRRPAPPLNREMRVSSDAVASTPRPPSDTSCPDARELRTLGGSADTSPGRAARNVQLRRRPRAPALGPGCLPRVIEDLGRCRRLPWFLRAQRRPRRAQAEPASSAASSNFKSSGWSGSTCAGSWPRNFSLRFEFLRTKNINTITGVELASEAP